MSVRTAHGTSIDEIKKYDWIYSIKNFSVAEYYEKHNGNELKAFRHNHDEYEFIIPLTTIPLLYYQKANYIGEVGFCYPVNPYVEHEIEFDLHSHVFSITIEKRYVEFIKSILGLENRYFYTRFLIDDRLLTLINKYRLSFNDQTSERENKIIKYAKEISVLLIRKGLENDIDNRRPEKHFNKNIRDIIVYMNDNFKDKELTISKLAEMSGYSLSYFTKSFKAYMHDTPILHLNKLRISEAKRLIIETDMPLGEIAHEVGYKNFSTFTEAFQTILNMTPTQFKRKFNN